MRRALSRCSGHRLIQMCMAAMLAVGLLAVAVPPAVPAGAQTEPDDAAFPYTASISATLDVQEGAYALEFDVTVRNLSDGWTYFEWGMVVPEEYVDVDASVGGQAVTHRRVPIDADGWIGVVFGLPQDFDPGNTLEFTVAARQPAFPGNIANAAYFDTTFVIGSSTFLGVAEGTRLTVGFPQGFDVEATGLGLDLDRSTDGGRTTFATDLQPDALFIGFFEGTRDSELRRETVEVGPVTVDVAGWPGEQQWMQSTTSTARESLAAIRRASDMRLPEGQELSIVRRNITETNIRPNGTIEVGDDLEARTVIEPVALAMFDGVLDDAWINAGLAATVIEAAVADVDGNGAAREPSLPLGPRPLNAWDPEGGLSSPDSLTDQQAFDAAWFIVDSVQDELGADGLAAVVDALRSGVTAYPADNGSADGETADGETADGDPEDEVARGEAQDWQRLLDHAEGAGATSIGQLYPDYVVTTDQVGLLDARDEAREAFGELAAASPDWDVAPAIRDAMDAWDFEVAHDLMAQASQARDRYDELAGTSGDWAIPPVIPTAMSEGDFDAVVSNVDTALEILERTGELDDDAHELGVEAPSVRSAYESETDDLGAVLDGMSRSRVAMDDLLEAQAAVDDDRSLLERIGLIGNDLDGKLDDAKAAFEEGDFGESSDVARGIVADRDDASSAGLRRVLLALLGIVVIAAIIVVVLIRRRPPSSERGTPPPLAGDGTPLAPPDAASTQHTGGSLPPPQPTG